MSKEIYPNGSNDTEYLLYVNNITREAYKYVRTEPDTNDQEQSRKEFVNKYQQRINTLQKGDHFTIEVDLDGCFVNGRIPKHLGLNLDLLNLLTQMKTQVKNKGATFQVNICSTADINYADQDIALNELIPLTNHAKKILEIDESITITQLIDKLREKYNYLDNINNQNDIKSTFINNLYQCKKHNTNNYDTIINNAKKTLDSNNILSLLDVNNESDIRDITSEKLSKLNNDYNTICQNSNNDLTELRSIISNIDLYHTLHNENIKYKYIVDTLIQLNDNKPVYQCSGDLSLNKFIKQKGDTIQLQTTLQKDLLQSILYQFIQKIYDTDIANNIFTFGEEITYNRSPSNYLLNKKTAINFTTVLRAVAKLILDKDKKSLSFDDVIERLLGHTLPQPDEYLNNILSDLIENKEDTKKNLELLIKKEASNTCFIDNDPQYHNQLVSTTDSPWSIGNGTDVLSLPVLSTLIYNPHQTILQPGNITDRILLYNNKPNDKILNYTNTHEDAYIRTNQFYDKSHYKNNCPEPIFELSKLQKEISNININNNKINEKEHTMYKMDNKISEKPKTPNPILVTKNITTNSYDVSRMHNEKEIKIARTKQNKNFTEELDKEKVTNIANSIIKNTIKHFSERAVLTTLAIKEQDVIEFIKQMQIAIKNNIDNISQNENVSGSNAGFKHWYKQIENNLDVGIDKDEMMKKFTLISAQIQKQSASTFDTIEGRKYANSTQNGARSFRIIQMLGDNYSNKSNFR